MSYEYKAVGAPERCKRVKGARSGSDRAAVAFEEVLREHARDGWEYLRTDILPVTEKRGWFGGQHEVHRAVIVFRRDRNRSDEAPNYFLRQPEGRVEGEPQLRSVPSSPEPREPSVSDSPDLRLAEIVRGPGSKRDDS